MIQRIDKFFVVDFDRCIGNIDASFNILKEVAHELSIVDRQLFVSMRKESESDGKTFSPLEHLKKNYSSVDLDTIEKMYLNQASIQKNSLFEPGANEFLNYLNYSNQNFCIMSFGDKRWQMIKIKGLGINDIPLEIVRKANKCNYIQKWFDNKNRFYLIPKKYFLDDKPRITKEIILIDDKAVAFDELPSNVRGYLVLGSSRDRYNQKIHSLPISVKIVNRINEIIALEF